MAAIRVLLPPLAIVERDAPAALRTMIARADRIEDAPRGRAAAASRAWSASSKPLAVAAALREAECGDAADASWVCADPGHARADLGALRLVRCGDLGLQPSESEALVRELKPLFGDAGFELSAPTPDRWFLRGIVSNDVPAAPDPEDILGDDLEAHLPAGPNGAKWRRLLNEAQVTLHNHPVNAARVARGELAANTLWFWGGGRRPELAKSFRSVAAVDRVLRALARMSGAALVAPEALGEAEAPALLDCWNAAQWQWFCASGHAVVTRRLGRTFDSIELEAWSGERFRYRRGHRWRFWRKPA